MSGAFEWAWSLLKALQPAVQDDPNSPESQMRHFQNMQNMKDIYTPRGNLNPPYIQQNPGAKPAAHFSPDFVAMNPWMEAANLEHQGRMSRNPADARMFSQQAEEARIRNTPVAVENPTGSVSGSKGPIDMKEFMSMLQKVGYVFITCVIKRTYAK